MTLTITSPADRFRELMEGTSLLATVPKPLPEFVPFGDFEIIKQIVQSKKFFPTFITGESGNGKTLFINQACAQTGREFIRVNITVDTDEDDLLGGFRLQNGETYFEPGPVVVAMLRGAVLLVDEIDLASSKIMCLQPIMEGKPVTLKKIGMSVEPAEGFTVFATANTKGRGDENGRFVGTGLLNEAFLERFVVTMEQQYPDRAVELAILKETYKQYGGKPNPGTDLYFDTLTKWAEAIRKTFKEGGIDDVMSTRRLTHIVRTFLVFGSTEQAQVLALQYCTNRFEASVAESFAELYNVLAPDSSAPSNVGAKKTAKAPF